MIKNSRTWFAVLLSGFLCLFSVSPAFSGVDVSNIELDFSNGGVDVGENAAAGDSFEYFDVVPGSTPEVNALLSVNNFINITTLDFVDENDHGGNKPIDFQMYNIVATGAYADLTVEFFDASSGDGFTDPISLDNLSITVKDIDIYQSIKVISPDSYELSTRPVSVLDVSSDGVAGTTTFEEPDGNSYSDRDEEVWVVLQYNSIDTFELTGFVKWGGSFTVEFKTTEYGVSSGSSTTRKNVGQPGIFLTVAGEPGRLFEGSDVVFGSYAVAPNSSYQLIVQSISNPSLINQVLATGHVNSGGHLERTIALPRLVAGSYKVILTGTGTGGERLKLTNHVNVDGSGKFTSVSAERLQPVLN